MSSNPFAEPYKELRESYYSTISTQVAKNMKVSGPHQLTDDIEASYDRLAKAINDITNQTFADNFTVDPSANTMRSLRQNIEATAGYIPMKRDAVQYRHQFSSGFDKPDTFEGGTTSMSEEYLLEYVDEDKKKEREARAKHLDYKDEVRQARRAWLKKANKNYGKPMDEEFVYEEEKWIQGAIKKPGALHRQLDVPEGEKIPAKKLAAARAGKYGAKAERRAELAKTLSKMHDHVEYDGDYELDENKLTPRQQYMLDKFTKMNKQKPGSAHKHIPGKQNVGDALLKANKSAWAMRGEGFDYHLDEDKDPCWAGYEMVGMKKKGGREVPNCVPKKSMKESYEDYIMENIDELVIYVSNSLSVPISYATRMVGDLSIEEALDLLDECMDEKPCKKCRKSPCKCMK